jgi:hypothetical protein
VKNKVSLLILLIIGFAFLVYMFPFSAIHAAKIQSGVTVIAPAANNPQTAGTCTDNNNDGVDDVTGQPCTSSDAAGAGKCELQIVSGVPINYGQLYPFQMDSAEQKVIIKNAGTSPAAIMVKGGDWISDATGATTFGSGNTRVTFPPNFVYALSTSGVYYGEGISVGQSIPIYFRFSPGIIPHYGSFHQDVTIDLIC